MDVGINVLISITFGIRPKNNGKESHWPNLTQHNQLRSTPILPATTRCRSPNISNDWASQDDYKSGCCWVETRFLSVEDLLLKHAFRAYCHTIDENLQGQLQPACVWIVPEFLTTLSILECTSFLRWHALAIRDKSIHYFIISNSLTTVFAVSEERPRWCNQGNISDILNGHISNQRPNVRILTWFQEWPSGRTMLNKLHLPWERRQRRRCRRNGAILRALYDVSQWQTQVTTFAERVQHFSWANGHQVTPLS